MFANDAKFSELAGLVLKAIDVSEMDDEIVFTSECGKIFRMYHQQDCCESVLVEDIYGDLKDLIGSPILMAEETTQRGDAAGGGSQTWTFYKLATQKGYVTIHWYGSSNGYYSESVDFVRMQ